MNNQGRRSSGGVGSNTPPPPIIQTLVKVGQNGTDICLKLKVKFGNFLSKFGIKKVEVAQSYEIIRNFKNFKVFVMFALKKLEALLILVGKF